MLSLSFSLIQCVKCVKFFAHIYIVSDMDILPNIGEHAPRRCDEEYAQMLDFPNLTGWYNEHTNGNNNK